MENTKVKQSLLIGALTSSFGVFVSKLLGLFYYSPLNATAGAYNMSFYNISYSYYEVLLQISSAGIPFAIAALVAKYAAKEDYKTVLLVKKMGISLVMGLSIIASIGFVFLANPLARQSLGSSAPLSDIEDLKRLFYILTIAVILVPFLSAIRGYCQGLKRLDIYASGQVLEQFVRVLSIIFFAYIFVKVLNFDSIWAIYMALAAASIGALIAIIYTKLLAKKDENRVEELAKVQEDPGRTKIEVTKEIIALGIPYLVVSVLSNATMIINTTFFIDYMTKVNGPEIYEYAKLSSGILQANCAKLSGIPAVISTGFCSSMVPYLTELLEKNDFVKLRKQVNQILEAALYVLVPMMLIFYFFSKDIYYIMYGSSNLELGADLLRTACFQYFFGVIDLIFSSMMVTLRLKGKTIVVLIVSFIIKFIVFFPCVKLFGTYGMSYSNAIYDFINISMYLFFLNKYYDVNIYATLKRFVLMLGCGMVMVIPISLLYELLAFDYSSRIIDIAYMGLCGILMALIYIYITIKLNLPQKIFGIKKPDVLKILSRFKG
ncbi:MAG: oligosaccharide flippase family protein [Firmicutes bacterium]|nr:oligosaccharide flippase family protein [Candidatus Colivicinus equi]